MTTLIIGGAGYIGSHVAKAMANLGQNTVVFDNLSTGHLSAVKWSEFVRGDTQNIENLGNVFSSYPIQSVMHLGDLSTVQESSLKPDTYYQNNVCGLINLLKIMKNHDVKKIIYSSTAAVYESSTLKSLTEDAPLNPISTYGRSKLIGEYILQDFFSAYGISSVSLRYFNAAGADLDADIGEHHENETHLIPNILNSILNPQEEFYLYGKDYPTSDGTCVRDFVHVMDIAEAHILAAKILDETVGCRVYNLGSESGYSILEVLSTCTRVTGTTPKYTIANRRAGDPPILIADSKKARSELGWKSPLSNIETIVQTAWNWHKKKHLQKEENLLKKSFF